MKKEIAKFVRKSVEWLVAEQQGCCTYRLDDHLAVCVGWSAGYGDEPRTDVIQAKDSYDWGINVGIKVWTSDAAMLTDYDWINFPYEEDGDVWDMGMAIAYQDDIADGLLESIYYEPLADALLRWYDEAKDLELDDTGLILKEE